MKKTLVVGVAGIALAAMPAVGAFAGAQTATISDTLSATITSACTFLRYGEAGAAGQTNVETDPAWDGATTASGNTDTNTYSATLKPTADVELGTSHFTAYCNSSAGFTVTVETPDLASGSNKIAFASTAPNATTGQGWTLTKQDNSLFASGNFMSSNVATDEANAVTEDATYTVYTNSSTAAGTYTGTVKYTFTYDDPAVSGS